jgi:hypothetical protein
MRKTITPHTNHMEIVALKAPCPRQMTVSLGFQSSNFKSAVNGPSINPP